MDADSKQDLDPRTHLYPPNSTVFFYSVPALRHPVPAFRPVYLGTITVFLVPYRLHFAIEFVRSISLPA